jgi:hypothetical protein
VPAPPWLRIVPPRHTNPPDRRRNRERDGDSSRPASVSKNAVQLQLGDSLEMADVACDELKAVMNCGGCDLEIGIG